MMSSRTVVAYALFSLMLLNTGCASFWHELQLHRLNRLNRGPAPSLDPGFIHLKRPSKTSLVKRDQGSPDAKLSVNSAEIATVRAQSHDSSIKP